MSALSVWFVVYGVVCVRLRAQGVRCPVSGICCMVCGVACGVMWCGYGRGRALFVIWYVVCGMSDETHTKLHQMLISNLVRHQQ